MLFLLSRFLVIMHMLLLKDWYLILANYRYLRTFKVIYSRSYGIFHVKAIYGYMLLIIVFYCNWDTINNTVQFYILCDVNAWR